MQAKKEWKEKVTQWFLSLQESICNTLEKIEESNGGMHSFEKKEWDRHDKTQIDHHGGKGFMRVMRGDVFEKAGVNVSTVFGELPKEYASQISGAYEDPSFWASGISVVIHPKNPYVPIVHMNTRMISTQKTWFGGGADLTPVFPFKEDTNFFHSALQESCDRTDPAFYAEFKQWCDEYFYIKHRNEPRGVGGIFYDNQYINNDDEFEKLFSFTKDIGITFEHTYKKIVLNHYQKPWNDDDEHQQSLKRSRYVEFNLVYDRGTLFGFKTNGNTEAILMSMPPKAIWP